MTTISLQVYRHGSSDLASRAAVTWMPRHGKRRSRQRGPGGRDSAQLRHSFASKAKDVSYPEATIAAMLGQSAETIPDGMCTTLIYLLAS